MKKIGLMIVGFSVFAPFLAYAEDAAVTATTVSSIAVPEGSPWYAHIIAAIFPLLLGFLTWLSARISMFIATKLAEVKTAEQNKWYAGAFVLAGMAVRAAETQYGPDTAKGAAKKAQAVQWLTDRLIAQDKDFLKKNPNAVALISGLVDAAYHDAFVAIAPLK